MSAPQMLLDHPGPDRPGLDRAAVRPAPLPGPGRLREHEEGDRAVRRQLRLLASRLRLERALGAGRAELLDRDPLATPPAEVARIVAARLGLPCEVVVPAARADERLLAALARAGVAEATATDARGARGGATATGAGPGGAAATGAGPSGAAATGAGPSGAATAGVGPSDAATAGVGPSDAATAGVGPSDAAATIVAPGPRGADRRAVAAFGAGPDRGLVVLAESGRSLLDADLRLLESAAAFLAGAVPARRQAGEALLRDAVHGTDSPASLRARAAQVGIDLGRGAAICLLADRTAPLAVEEVGAAASRVAPGLAHQLASDAAGVLLLAPLAGGAERQGRGGGGRGPLAEPGARHLEHRPPVEAVPAELGLLVDHLRAGGRPELTAACADSVDVEGLPRALEECLALLPGREPEAVGVAVRGAEELGVVRLLLGRVPAAAAERFVAATLGAIEGEGESAKLIDTLEAFFAANGSVRATAAGLAIHENTVRHRFRRLAAATGLDVLGSTDDRLTARMALTLHRLRPFPGKGRSSNAPARKEPK